MEEVMNKLDQRGRFDVHIRKAEKMKRSIIISIMTPAAPQRNKIRIKLCLVTGVCHKACGFEMKRFNKKKYHTHALRDFSGDSSTITFWCLRRGDWTCTAHACFGFDVTLFFLL